MHPCEEQLRTILRSKPMRQPTLLPWRLRWAEHSAGQRLRRLAFPDLGDLLTISSILLLGMGPIALFLVLSSHTGSTLQAVGGTLTVFFLPRMVGSWLDHVAATYAWSAIVNAEKATALAASHPEMAADFGRWLAHPRTQREINAIIPVVDRWKTWKAWVKKEEAQADAWRQVAAPALAMLEREILDETIPAAQGVAVRTRL